MTRAIVIGDSHAVALKAAPKREQIEVYRFVKEKSGGTIGDLPFDEIFRIIRSDPSCIVVSALGGNQHQMYLIEHSQPFDFVEPGNDSIAGGHEIIPYNAMYEFFRGNVVEGSSGKRISELRKAAKRQIYHLEVPPPKKDEAHIRKRVETQFRDKIQAGTVFTRPEVRAKLWRLQRSVTMDFCREIGVTYLSVPDGTKEDGDFLHPTYYARDATHANAAFGDLVLAQLERIIN